MAELVTIEFRYHGRPDYDGFGENRSETITIGIYDTLEEAVKEGNKAVQKLAEKGIQVRSYDRFKVHGLFGRPERLVSNCFYPTKGIQYFAKITELKFGSISDIIDKCFAAYKEYLEYKTENNGE